MVLEAAPTGILVGVACVLAWREQGSVAARDWLGWAVLAGVLLAVAVASGLARKPSRAELAALGALTALAGWAALSLTWAPLPSLARDEAALTLLYAAVLAVPMLTLRSRESRIAALAAFVLVLGAVAVATAARVAFGDDPLTPYAGSGRLFFPVTYVNGQAAFALIAFWPAVALGARKGSGIVLRSLALGSAAALLAVAVLTQSRGGAAALALSAVIVFACLPARLRLAVAALVPVAVVAPFFQRLTDPYEAQFVDAELLATTIVSAGEAALLVVAAGLVLGLAYVLIDRRIELAPRARAMVGRAAALLVVTAVAGGAAAVTTSVDEPRELLSERWEQFKFEPTEYTTETHFLAPGSNRYDFWRVALLAFRDEPILGQGSRSFGPEYLIRGESRETPARTHSLLLEVLAENGIVGFLLLVAALGLVVALLLRKRAQVPAAAAFAGASYWLPHAAVDWTWTFPACGIPFFALLGIGLARDGASTAGRAAIAAGAAIAVVTVGAFAPPWLANRYLERGAARGLPAGGADFDRARSLDPLLTDTLLVRAQLEPRRETALQLLRQAADEEPESVRNQFLLGRALLDAGRLGEARTVLLRAQALYPRSEHVRGALARTRP